MAKDKIARFGVSLSRSPLKELDRMVRQKGYKNCLGVLVVRGRASVVKSVAEHLIAVRGVKRGKLMLTTTGKDLPE